MTSRNREIDLQHRYFLHSKTSLWILQLKASRSFLGVGVHPSLLMRQDDIVRYYFLAVWKLWMALPTLSLWADLIRNIRWGVCRCDGLHGGPWEDVPCWLFVLSPLFSRPVAKGFGGFYLSLPQHLLWLHKVTFGRLVAARGFQNKYVVHADESVLFSSTKAIEQYFHVALFIMLHKVVLTFKSVDDTLTCDHSNESCWALVSGSVIILPQLSRKVWTH